MQRSEINEKTSVKNSLKKKKEFIFKHRELSESEATLPAQGTGTSQQVPPSRPREES